MYFNLRNLSPSIVYKCKQSLKLFSFSPAFVFVIMFLPRDYPLDKEIHPQLNLVNDH